MALSESTIVSIVLGSAGLTITWLYGHYNRKMAHDRLEKELFREFNERYDALNESLEKIKVISDNGGTLQPDSKLRSDLNDYYNLCAEEFYWFNKGRINKRIWKSWQMGMNYWYSHAIIADTWDIEIHVFGEEAYYLKKGERFFISKENNQKL